MDKSANLQQINTNQPRETVALFDGDRVIKRPAPRVPASDWMTKQMHARIVSDSVRVASNNKYFIPRVLELSQRGDYFVAEERAPGKPLTDEFYATLAPADKDAVYSAIANFLNDMNQMRPVLTQKQNFDGDTNGAGATAMPFAAIVEKLRGHLSSKDIATLRKAKDLFDRVSENATSVVFTHGDMNENNIFYDPETKTTSFIDFAEAKYQLASYMIDTDFARLHWLDTERLRREYMALPRKQPVNIDRNLFVDTLRTTLKNFKWSAIEYIKNPKSPTAKFRMNTMLDYIAEMRELQNDVAAKFTAADQVLQATAQVIDKSAEISTPPHGLHGANR